MPSLGTYRGTRHPAHCRVRPTGQSSPGLGNAAWSSLGNLASYSPIGWASILATAGQPDSSRLAKLAKQAGQLKLDRLPSHALVCPANCYHAGCPMLVKGQLWTLHRPGSLAKDTPIELPGLNSSIQAAPVRTLTENRESSMVEELHRSRCSPLPRAPSRKCSDSLEPS